MLIEARDLLFGTTLFNLVGAGVAGGTALFVYRRYAASPIFLFWAQGFLYSLLVLALEVSAVWMGRTPLMIAVEGALLACAVAACLRMGDHFAKRPLHRALSLSLLAVLYLVTLGLALTGAPLQAIAAPLALAFAGSLFRIAALVLAPHPDLEGAGDRRLMALATASLGLWPVAYTWLVGTPYLWAGHLVAGSIDFVLGVGMVILALAEASAYLKQRCEQLDRVRMDFISVASHELRTPLTSIMGYSEFLEEGVGGSLSGNQKQFVSHIQGGAQRLQRIVDDILDYARMEAGSFRLTVRRVDLCGIVREELASLMPQATAAGVTLRAEVPREAVHVTVDPTRIGQVVTNLVNNAIKFTPDGGTITVQVQAEAESVTVGVRDTGIGIPPHEVPRLFEKFYQVDRALTREHGGTGLGLSICKALVESHGGRIGVESHPGEGSRFWFSLALRPMVESTAELTPAPLNR